MKYFWICAFLVASFSVYSKAQNPDDADEYQDEYNDYENFDDLIKKIDEEINKLNEKTDIENDLKVDEEIQKFIADEPHNDDVLEESKESDNNLDDYQYEDNREDLNNAGTQEELKSNQNTNVDGNRLEPDDKDSANHNEDYALLWGDDSVAPLPVPEVDEEVEEQAILEETQKLLNEHDANNFEEEIKKEIGEEDMKSEDKPILEETQKFLDENDDNDFEKLIKEAIGEDIISEAKPILEETTKNVGEKDTVEEDINKEIENQDIQSENQQNFEEIIDETKQLLAEEEDNETNDFNETADEITHTTNKESAGMDITENKEEPSQEDTADKAFADLNADLDKLFKTLDKLRGDSSDDDAEDEDEEAENTFEDTNDLEGSEELVKDDDNEEDSPVDIDKLLADILSEVDMKEDNKAIEDLLPLVNDELSEPNPDDSIGRDAESIDSKLEPILYINDALVDNKAKNAETIESNEDNVEINASVEDEVKKTLVDDLSSAEMEDLVSQFSILHSEDLDVHSETFEKDVVPERISLKVDEPTIITSPYYPNPYPTNNTWDWILEGVGEGVELNVTEFAVNGALGDYLLIKPGGVDDSGHDGILFTYRLSTARRYRFTNVDRVFMRFESQPGIQSYKGFVISAKMIAPLSEDPEPIPEPEAVVTPPHSLATLTLAMSVPNFRAIREEFRLILADMAEEYIRENDIDPGRNTTSEITQITSVGLCPITWPGHERCVAVTFGVSLVYEGEQEESQRLNSQDLQDMWNTYSTRDPFALRLERLAITEFFPPNSSAMTAWLVIAGGVVISMMMLAFVLWRFSCFEDYTRMKAYSDTDSIHNEKRHLDLYPTPHQTLPPLFAENEYKWHEEDSTRVDMGGFANRSYAQENMYDFESDEEVVTPRDRHGANTKDISNV